MNKVFKYIFFFLIILFAYRLYAFSIEFRKKSSLVDTTSKEYSEFLPYISDRSTTYFYIDKKQDIKQYFILHHIFAPNKILVYLGDKHNYEYVLIKDYHKIKQKENFIGDTLHSVHKKDYSIHLLKIK